MESKKMMNPFLYYAIMSVVIVGGALVMPQKWWVGPFWLVGVMAFGGWLLDQVPRSKKR